ncbi:MAG: Gfo/Idh/MocA family oxidoreductase [Clostridia bacterium]|nr:Gfo/Idh/MocA family oxidoreductase [Clostridia bacterium]
MKKTINVAVIGLGGRGSFYATYILTQYGNDSVRITALCDLYQDRVDHVAEEIEKKTGVKPFRTLDYRDILRMKDVDAVVVTSSWESHVEICLNAMEAGIPCAIEVGGAYSVEDCFKLVETHERTGVPVTMLENCCYGRNELMLLNMVRKGVLGEVIHCRGGYCHDLRGEISFGRENRHYRLNNYMNRNCENYPTHEIGPIASVLDINRGNRFTSLVSVASKSEGLNRFLEKEKGPSYDLTSKHFAQGDVVNTLITCANGQTVSITLETTLPRPYSRQFEVHGTGGTYIEDNNSVFLDNEEYRKKDFAWSHEWNNLEKLREEYEHPMWKKYLEEGVKGGHGGMDWLVMSEFINCVKAGKQMPTDVYDMATWMAITPLSEISIRDKTFVEFPDFTSGKWKNRKNDLFT